MIEVCGQNGDRVSKNNKSSRVCGMLPKVGVRYTIAMKEHTRLCEKA